MSSKGTRLQNPKDQTGEMLQRVKALSRQAQCLNPRTCAEAGYSDLSVIPAQDGGRIEAGERSEVRRIDSLGLHGTQQKKQDRPCLEVVAGGLVRWLSRHLLLSLII